MSWQRVRGHDALIRMFERARQRGRLAHAYLFTGPDGIGKKRFAIELAKTILCENPPLGRFDSCDACPGCVQVEAGTHPDFVLTGRPTDSHELPIAVMRELCGTFSLKAARGRGKVAILDDADDLNEESANCFLKTLEEPPPRSVLILIGTTPERQLATIVSRCQVVRFAPLPEALVRELLKREGIDDEALLTRLARASGGSPGQARALADADLWEFRRTMVAGLSQPKPNSVELAKAWMEFTEAAGKESAVQRQRAGLVLRLLTEFLTDALRLSHGGTARQQDPDEERMLRQLAERLAPEPILDLLERCLAAEEHLDRRVQLVLLLEALLDALGAQIQTR